MHGRQEAVSKIFLVILINNNVEAKSHAKNCYVGSTLDTAVVKHHECYRNTQLLYWHTQTMTLVEESLLPSTISKEPNK